MDDRSSAGSDAALAPRAKPPKKPVRPAARPTPRRDPAAGSGLDPTILLVGADSTFEPALRAALLRYRVYVETTTADAVANTVIATAPDLVLLVGPAARDGGSSVLRTLMSSSVCSVIPVAILDDNAALDMRLRAFRHGAAAVIAPSASIDAIAAQVAKLAREIPERGSESLGVVGEATLSEFVAALSGELRSGILSVHTGGSNDEAVRLVLGSGRPLAAFIDDFVRQVKSHVVHAEPLHYEFAEHPSGTVALLDAKAPVNQPQRTSVKGVRVVLADDDTGRADTVAQELRSRGVSVVVTDLAPTDVRFAKLRQVDPEVLLIGEAHVKGPGYELVRRMRRDTRLRWASLLVVRWDEIWSDALSVPGLDRLETALAALSEADRTLHTWAETRNGFDARLELTGPARCLRALAASPHPVRLTVNNPRVTIQIDISDGLVVGASGQSGAEASEQWQGALALAAFMVLSSGRIHVEPVTQPAATNVMTTVDVALNMADSERAPISPSVPVVATESVPPPNPESALSNSLRPLTEASTRLANSESALTSSLRPLTEASTRLADSVLGPARSGISRSASLLFAGLAALQGLVLVAVLSLLSKPAQPTLAKRAASSASSPRALGSESAPAPVVVPGPALGAQGAAAAGGALSVPGADAANPARDGADESGLQAPSCEQILGSALATGNNPSAAFIEMQRANRALVQGDVDASQRAMCQAAYWNQTNPAIPLQLAQLMLLRHDGAKAIEWANKALELEPGNARALGVLGDALARVGEYARAKTAWLASQRREIASPEQFKALSLSSEREALTSMRRRDFARAERFFRRAVVLDLDNVTASNGLGNALLKQGDLTAALSWANHSLSVAPRNVAAHLILGDVLFQKGDLAAAELAWRDALTLDPGNEVAQRRLEHASRAP